MRPAAGDDFAMESPTESVPSPDSGRRTSAWMIVLTSVTGLVLLAAHAVTYMMLMMVMLHGQTGGLSTLLFYIGVPAGTVVLFPCAVAHLVMVCSRRTSPLRRRLRIILLSSTIPYLAASLAVVELAFRNGSMYAI